MVDYVRMASMAQRLIQANGRLVNFYRPTAGTPADPLKPWGVSTEAAVKYPVKAVIYDPQKREDNYAFAIRIDPGTDIRRVDLYVLVSANDLPFVPANGDRVEDTARGRVLNIVTVSPLDPGDTPVAYILQTAL